MIGRSRSYTSRNEDIEEDCVPGCSRKGRFKSNHPKTNWVPDEAPPRRNTHFHPSTLPLFQDCSSSDNQSTTMTPHPAVAPKSSPIQPPRTASPPRPLSPQDLWSLHEDLHRIQLLQQSHHRAMASSFFPAPLAGTHLTTRGQSPSELRSTLLAVLNEALEICADASTPCDPRME